MLLAWSHKRLSSPMTRTKMRRRSRERENPAYLVIQSQVNSSSTSGGCTCSMMTATVPKVAHSHTVFVCSVSTVVQCVASQEPPERASLNTAHRRTSI